MPFGWVKLKGESTLSQRETPIKMKQRSKKESVDSPNHKADLDADDWEDGGKIAILNDLTKRRIGNDRTSRENRVGFGQEEEEDAAEFNSNDIAPAELNKQSRRTKDPKENTIRQTDVNRP